MHCPFKLVTKMVVTFENRSDIFIPQIKGIHRDMGYISHIPHSTSCQGYIIYLNTHQSPVYIWIYPMKIFPLNLKIFFSSNL